MNLVLYDKGLFNTSRHTSIYEYSSFRFHWGPCIMYEPSHGGENPFLYQYGLEW